MKLSAFVWAWIQEEKEEEKKRRRKERGMREKAQGKPLSGQQPLPGNFLATSPSPT